MADKAKDPAKKQKRTIKAKAKPTMREQAAKNTTTVKADAKRSRKSTSSTKQTLGRSFHLPKLPGRLGRWTSKHIPFHRLVPRFIGNSVREIGQVTWPNRAEATKLTIAVFVFSIAVAALVWALDYVFGEIFREVFLR